MFSMNMNNHFNFYLTLKSKVERREKSWVKLSKFAMKLSISPRVKISSKVRERIELIYL